MRFLAVNVENNRRREDRSMQLYNNIINALTVQFNLYGSENN